MALVQARKIEASSGTSVTVNSAWTVSAGNLLNAWITSYQGAFGNHVASGSVNGTFTAVGGATYAANCCLSTHYKKNSSSGLENLTANGGTGANGVVGVFHEVSAMDTTAPFTAGEYNIVTYTAATNPQTGSITNSAANSVFFAALTNMAGGNPATLTVNSTGSNPTGWALKDATNSQETNAATYMALSVAYLVVSSGAATKHGWTTDNNVGIKGIVCFKAASGGSVVTGGATGNAAASLGAGGLVTELAGATLAAVAGLSAGGSQTVLAGATLSTIAALTAAGVRGVPGDAVLSVAAGLSAAGLQTALAGASLSTAAGLSAAGYQAILGGAALSSGATLGAGGLLVIPGNAALSLSAILSAACGGSIVTGDAALSMGAGLSASGLRGVLGNAALEGVAGLSAGGYQTILSQAILNCGGSLAASGLLVIPASAAISLTAQLSAAGIQVVLITGTAAWSALAPIFSLVGTVGIPQAITGIVAFIVPGYSPPTTVQIPSGVATFIGPAVRLNPLSMPAVVDVPVSEPPPQPEGMSLRDAAMVATGAVAGAAWQAQHTRKKGKHR